jgi:DNA-binding NtrC family response regulator
MRERKERWIEPMGELQIEQDCAEARFLAVGDMPETDPPLVRMLADRGLAAEVCSNGRQALTLLTHTCFQGVLCDYTAGGMELLDEVRTNFPEVAVIMIMESGHVRQGVLAMIAGASDYLLKPLQPDAVVASLHRAVKRKRLERGLEKYQTGQREAVNGFK